VEDLGDRQARLTPEILSPSPVKSTSFSVLTADAAATSAEKNQRPHTVLTSHVCRMTLILESCP
jgi:hypothetical protein